MKKILLSAAALFCLSTAAFSQTKGTNVVSVQVGLNLANVTASGISNNDYKAGFNAGLNLDHYFSDSWSLKIGALYDQKGWGKGYFESTTTDFKLDYITVPVLANWHFGRTKNWYLNFGPYVSFLTSAKTSIGSNDVKDFFNTTDAGIDLGIGIKLPVSETTKFFIELSGQGGIANINKDATGATIRNQVSSINVGINF
ncbi:porin family protein [Mucilaginibacter conchicola]|nr:porin family protein [Mucilaginibacter conchicola]